MALSDRTNHMPFNPFNPLTYFMNILPYFSYCWSSNFVSSSLHIFERGAYMSFLSFPQSTVLLVLKMKLHGISIPPCGKPVAYIPPASVNTTYQNTTYSAFSLPISFMTATDSRSLRLPTSCLRINSFPMFARYLCIHGTHESGVYRERIIRMCLLPSLMQCRKIKTLCMRMHLML